MALSSSNRLAIPRSAEFVWQVAPCIAANVVASLGAWLQPSTFDGLRRGLHLSEAAAGLLAGVEIAAVPLVSILLGLGMRRLPMTMRVLALMGCGLVVSGNVISIFLDGFAPLVAVRAVAGVGQGCLLAAATAVLVKTVAPQKLGYVVASYIFCVTPALLIAPSVVGPFAQKGAFGLMAVLTVLLIPLIARLPAMRAVPGTASMTTVRSLRGWTLLAASILWATTWGFVWAFSIELGSAAGFDLGEMGFISGAGVICSALGSLCESLSSGIPRQTPLLVAVIALQTVSILSVIAIKNPGLFAAGTLLVCFCANFTYPQLLGVAVHLDEAGGLSSMVAGSFFFSGIASPVIGGFLISSTGTYAALSVFTLGAFFLIMALLAVVLRREDSPLRAES
jgi:MFS transporter, DHA1 family, inner membrane transport protein